MVADGFDPASGTCVLLIHLMAVHQAVVPGPRFPSQMPPPRQLRRVWCRPRFSRRVHQRFVGRSNGRDGGREGQVCWCELLEHRGVVCCRERKAVKC
jgi:hypothetical protein